MYTARLISRTGACSQTLRKGLSMFLRSFVFGIAFLVMSHAEAATPIGDAKAGRDLVTRGCTTCHAANETTRTADGAPPLSYIVRDNKERPEWIKGWLLDPHDPMPSIMLSRRQIADIVAYLNSLAAHSTEQPN